MMNPAPKPTELLHSLGEEQVDLFQPASRADIQASRLALPGLDSSDPCSPESPLYPIGCSSSEGESESPGE